MHEKVKQAQAGDVTAFGELVKMFQDAVYGMAYAMVGNFEDAQDIAQEAFIQAWRKLDTLKDPVKFPNWLCRITKNRCMDFLRQAKLDAVRLEEAITVHDPLPGPLEQAEKKELAESVLAAVRALPEQLRLTTTLFYINGYTVNEISEFLQVPAGTIKRRLHDSRQRLKENMMKDKKMIEIMVGDTLKSFPLPGDFANIVVRLVASDEDIKQYDELMGGSAGSVAEAQRHGKFVVEDNGQVESAGMINEGQWTIGSTIVKSAGSHAGVAGEGEGVPDALFVKGYKGHFKLCKERGIHLALVHGTQYDHGFCGFVPCFYYAVATLPVEKAKSIVTSAIIREVRDEKEEKAAREALARDPYRTRMSASPVRVVERNGVTEGYITVDQNGYPRGCTLKTREAALAVIKLMGEHGVEVMESHMTMITQTILSLGGKYLLRASCDVVALDAEMAAIVDLVGLTQDLKEEFQRRLNASPAHDMDGCFSIEMSGTTVGFVVNSGRVEIVTQKQKIHRILPRWVVTRLYMGYYSGEDVLAMGPIPYDRSNGKTPDNPDLDMKELHLPENEAALFMALFPKLWPCSEPDPDVSPWVIGEEYPRYRHGDEEPSERKAQIDALRFPWIGY
jgi:RNA polymerase sigma factor (sigma-70 family)